MFSLFSLPSNQDRGFSLLEVLITAAIIGIVTALVVVRYGAFNNSVLLKSQAFEMALDLREAQVFAVSVRGEASTFRQTYGIHFDTSTPNQYLLFIDTDEDDIYDSGEEIGAPFVIDSRFSISQIEMVGGSTHSDVSVTFHRPDFDARFSQSGSAARITIASEDGDTRSVLVSSSGQITVE